MQKAISSTVDFPKLEREWLDKWQKGDIVAKYLNKNKNSKKYFSFLDGPITANNPMGIHHAWGRTYKDLWQKFHNLLGYKMRFQNGFDCQGLWVEVEVEKELGLKGKKDIENLLPGDRKGSIAKFVELCKARVAKFSSIQTEQTKRLGNFMDWDHSYFTMSDENNYMIWHFLKVCHGNGWIYKGRESVPWCPRCETAISQHEMLTEDYKEVVHESIYLALPCVGRSNEFLLVWTTTPWTIPANIAIAVDKKLDYSLVEFENNKYWVAKKLVDSVFEKKDKKVLKNIKGSDLVGLKYHGPFDDLEIVAAVGRENPKTFHTVIATDDQILPISTLEGTGLVHTAVSAGVEDFKLGRKYGLPMIPVIADNADYLPGLGQFSGKNAKKNPRLILDYLTESDKKNSTNVVFKIHNYKHRYPACWRCKKELVWKVADEWYIAMDLKSKVKSQKSNETLRQRMMEVAKKIKWMPGFGLERELDWLKNMHDWLISKKNRYWGLALPIYVCSTCQAFEVIGSKEELKTRAVSGWEQFEGHTPHKPFIDEVVIACLKCGQTMSRIADVGNPWLDAGIVPYSTIATDNQGEPLYLKNKDEWRKWFPVDFITESFPGQFKNWFYALIAESTVLENINPFKRVLGFGTQLGEDGRAMHKSWGNAIEFNEGADKIGVDVIRWMFVRHNPAENMLFGYKRGDEVRRQFYLILWNVYKYFVDYSNLDKWNNKEIKSKNLLDKWILSRLNGLIAIVEKYMRDYKAKEAAHEIELFVSDLSTWYLRRCRDRVWVNSEDPNDKNAFYSTFYRTLVNLSVILSPFMPFISEEIFTNLTGEMSVHLVSWPTVDATIVDLSLEKEMALVRKIAEVGHAWRKENGKKVRLPLAKIEIEVKDYHGPIRNEVWDILLKELNIRNIVVNKKIRYPQTETVVTDLELEFEGKLRDLVREIQGKRKEMGLTPNHKIRIVIPTAMKRFSAEISRKVVAGEVQYGDAVRVEI